MKDERYRDNRGNIILLSVIAIVTMVIVLVGATFAYLASNIEGSNTSNINAVTNAGSDLLLITPGDDLLLSANEDNFGRDDGDLSVNSTATILLQTTNTTDVTKTYSVKLDIVQNNFEYTSGQCYIKPTGDGVINEMVTREDSCTSSNNVWATADGINYSCYYRTVVTTTASGAPYTNRLGCLSSNNHIWKINKVPELVIDLYKNNTIYIDSDACSSYAGDCVGDGVIDSSLRNKTSCEADNKKWYPSVWEDGICYTFAVSKDVTAAAAGTSHLLLGNEEITANAGTNGGSSKVLYKPFVTFVNFEHNQIINGNKAFQAGLVFALTTPSP